MSKPGLIKQLIAGAMEYLAPMGYKWLPDRSEFWAEKRERLDRIYCNIWTPDFDHWITLAFYRYLPEVEIFRELYGPIIDGLPDGKLCPTIHTNPSKIKSQAFDLFSYGPHYAIRLNLKEVTADQLLQQFREMISVVILPVVDKYNSIEELDRFLHHDIEDLPKLGLIDFYSKKGWLMEYRWLFAKSLYIAKKANNPNSQLIYEVCHAHLKPHYGQGSAANDNLYDVLERVYKG